MLTRAFSFQREWKQIDTSFSLILHNELQLQQKHHLHLIIKVLHVPGMLQKKKNLLKILFPYWCTSENKNQVKRCQEERRGSRLCVFSFKTWMLLCWLNKYTQREENEGATQQQSSECTHTHPARLASDHHGWLPDVIFPPEKQLKANKGWIPALIVLVVSRELLFLCPCTHTTPCLHRKLNIWWLQMTSDLQHVQEEP